MKLPWRRKPVKPTQETGAPTQTPEGTTPTPYTGPQQRYPDGVKRGPVETYGGGWGGYEKD